MWKNIFAWLCYEENSLVWLCYVEKVWAWLSRHWVPSVVLFLISSMGLTVALSCNYADAWQRSRRRWSWRTPRWKPVLTELWMALPAQRTVRRSSNVCSLVVCARSWLCLFWFWVQIILFGFTVFFSSTACEELGFGLLVMTIWL